MWTASAHMANNRSRFIRYLSTTNCIDLSLVGPGYPSHFILNLLGLDKQFLPDGIDSISQVEYWEAEEKASIQELSEAERGIFTAKKSSESREKIEIFIRENIKNCPEKILQFLPILIKIRPDLFSTFIECCKDYFSEKLSQKCIKKIL